MLSNSRVLDYYIIPSMNSSASQPEEALQPLEDLLMGPPSADRTAAAAALQVCRMHLRLGHASGASTTASALPTLALRPVLALAPTGPSSFSFLTRPDRCDGSLPPPSKLGLLRVRVCPMCPRCADLRPYSPPRLMSPKRSPWCPFRHDPTSKTHSLLLWLR